MTPGTKIKQIRAPGSWCSVGQTKWSAALSKHPLTTASQVGWCRWCPHDRGMASQLLQQVPGSLYKMSPSVYTRQGPFCRGERKVAKRFGMLHIWGRRSCLLVGPLGTLPIGPAPGSTWPPLAAPLSPGGSQARAQTRLEGS